MKLSPAQVRERVEIERFYAHEGVDLEPSGTNRTWPYRGLCPFHDDHNPSLSVGDEGQFNCFAASCGAKGDLFEFVKRHRKVTFPDALRYIAAFAGVVDESAKSTLLAHTFDEASIAQMQAALTQNPSALAYLRSQRALTDEMIHRAKLGWDASSGRIAIPVEATPGWYVRLYDRHAIGDKMIWKKSPTDARELVAPLYRAPGFDEATDVLLVEGEFDALVAAQNGFPAASGTLGARTWESRWTPSFMGKHVTILYDADEGGRSGARNAAAALADDGIQVEVAMWPDDLGDEGYDVTDHYVRGLGSEELRTILATAQHVEPERPFYTLAELLAGGDAEDPVLVGTSEAVVLRQGSIAMIVGAPKTLKSEQTFEIGLALANGHPLYEQFPIPKPAAVLFVVLEGSEHYLRRRLKWLTMARDVEPSSTELFFVRGRPGLVREADLHRLEDAISKTSPALVVIDTFTRAAAGKDLNEASELAPLFNWMERTRDCQGTAFLLVHHMRKGKADTQGERILGSTAIYAAADTLMYVEHAGSPSDKQVRVELQHRDGGEPPPFVLGLRTAVEGDDGHAWLEFGGLAPKSKGPAEAPVRAALLVHFGDHESATREELLAAKIGSPSSLKAHLGRLVSDGFLVRSDVKGKAVWIRTEKIPPAKF